jgi:hypothetical protein
MCAMSNIRPENTVLSDLLLGVNVVDIYVRNSGSKNMIQSSWRTPPDAMQSKSVSAKAILHIGGTFSRE